MQTSKNLAALFYIPGAHCTVDQMFFIGKSLKDGLFDILESYNGAVYVYLMESSSVLLAVIAPLGSIGIPISL